MDNYSIIRFYQDNRERRVTQTGLTLEEAQSHCQDPESSSSTTTDPDEEPGGWFDGYSDQDYS